MRTFPVMSGAVAIAVLFGLLAPAVGRGDPSTPGAHVLVIFDHPENFLDIRDRYFATDFGENEILSVFREYITRRAAKYLPEGYAFYIGFTDIKLAGAYPLWGIQEYRVITRRDPPGFVFGWAITNRSGDVVKKGAERLQTFAFMELYGCNTSEGEAFYYEKAILDDWMRNNLEF